jgi:hypothetical protein
MIHCAGLITSAFFHVLADFMYLYAFADFWVNTIIYQNVLNSLFAFVYNDKAHGKCFPGKSKK